MRTIINSADPVPGEERVSGIFRFFVVTAMLAVVCFGVVWLAQFDEKDKRFIYEYQGAGMEQITDTNTGKKWLIFNGKQLIESKE